jgi:hypothetical protein
MTSFFSSMLCTPTTCGPELTRPFSSTWEDMTFGIRQSRRKSFRNDFKFRHNAVPASQILIYMKATPTRSTIVYSDCAIEQSRGGMHCTSQVPNHRVTPRSGRTVDIFLPTRCRMDTMRTRSRCCRLMPMTKDCAGTINRSVATCSEMLGGWAEVPRSRPPSDSFSTQCS